MPPLSQYEIEREANIARNRALLEQLELTQAVASLPSKAPKAEPKAKPVQPSKRSKASKEAEAPRRQSARLRRGAVDPNEAPSQKRKREAKEEERLAKEAEERLEAEERARAAKRPRHHDLDIQALVDDLGAEDISTLTEALQAITKEEHPRRAADIHSYADLDDEQEEREVAELRSKLRGLKVVARAKVTEDRVYSAVYHPEPSKDLIFFGDKHGQLGIWDARAAPDEVADEDDDVTPTNKESGKYWRLQLHWPATSKSSISCLKLNPVNSHSLYSTSYDCTIRNLSFGSGASTEVFSTTDNTLISSIDLTPTGVDMWISDALGGVTHLDLREDKSKARWYGLSDQKIGSLSLNPTQPNFMVTASNSRALRIWDLRMLRNISRNLDDEDAPITPPPSSPGAPEDGNNSVGTDETLVFDSATVSEYTQSKRGEGCLRGEWRHDKSVSSAYWDPRGRSIVSTSYDDTLRLWDFSPSCFAKNSPFPSARPFSRLRHNCQTGRWLTILRAQWTPNPDVYPHFTIGNMDHSLDIFTCKGDLITRLSDPKRITAVQAVTCSHPNVLERAASGNGSGRCVLWAPA